MRYYILNCFYDWIYKLVSQNKRGTKMAKTGNSYSYTNWNLEFAKHLRNRRNSTKEHIKGSKFGSHDLRVETIQGPPMENVFRSRASTYLKTIHSLLFKTHTRHHSSGSIKHHSRASGLQLDTLSSRPLRWKYLSSSIGFSSF
jgi:hypothetical protein